uniref:Uncharacterized protein n=1 Tax=Rhizophora mucronata TaxID=61149 RepID=A0A2P2PPH1_RHIMU
MGPPTKKTRKTNFLYSSGLLSMKATAHWETCPT